MTNGSGCWRVWNVSVSAAVSGWGCCRLLRGVLCVLCVLWVLGGERLCACVQARAVKLEAELTREKGEASKRELQLVAERDARGEPRHFEELKKFHDSYEQVRGSLDRCLELLQVRPAGLRAARAPGGVALHACGSDAVPGHVCKQVVKGRWLP